MNPSGVLQRLLEVAITGGNRIPDPGASGTIRVDRNFGVVPIVTAAAESRTLPAPPGPGLFITPYMATDGGDCTMTVTGGYDEAGSTTLTYSAIGQYATLVSIEQTVGTYVWRVVGYDGVTGPSVDIDTVDVTTLKIGGTTVDATAAELNRAADLSARIVNVTASTLALTLASHSDRTVTVNAAAGCAITLPAATGTGARFRIFIGTTITSNTTTITRAGSDTLFGMIYQLANDGSTLAAYECAGSTVITLNGTTTGGVKGDWFELEDVASATWHIIGHTSATGTEATPVT